MPEPTSLKARRLGGLFAFVLAAACGSKTPAPTPAPPPNAPVASIAKLAGGAAIGAAVKLDGSKSRDPDGRAIAFAWELVARPAGSDAVFDDAASATPSFTPDVVGHYEARLVVTDTLGLASPPAYVSVAAATCGAAALGAPVATVASIADPEAGAVTGPPSVGALVTLSAAADDPNAACGALALPLRYRWALLDAPAGSRAALSSTTDPAPAFVPDVQGAYLFTVSATDALGNASPPATLSVATTQCGALRPVVAVTGDATVNTYAPASFTAAASTPDAGCPARFGGLTYSIAWSVAPHAALSDATGPSTTFVASAPGTYAVTAVATDSAGRASDPASATIAVSPCGAYPPVAAGFEISQAVPAFGGSSGMVTDLPLAVGASATSGGSATSAAGFYLGLPLAVTASGVSDADAITCGLPSQPVSYAWSLTSAPLGSQAKLSNPAASGVLFTPDLAGPYVLSVTTTDDTGASATSTLSLGVSCGASAPSITAVTGTQVVGGAVVATPNSMSIRYPVTFDAAASDPDATAGGACTVAEAQPLAYHWEVFQLPAGSAATLTAPDTRNAGFTPDVPGMYGFRVTVTDPQGHSQNMLAAVAAICGATPPVVATAPGTFVPQFTASQLLSVNGGHALQLQHSSWMAPTATLDGAPSPAAPLYPGQPVQLAANVVPGTQPGCPATGGAIGYRWSIAQLPAGSAARLGDPSASAPSFTPDLPGSYGFALQLTDALGNTSTTALTTDVNGQPVSAVGACGTHAPVVVASATAPIPPPPSGVATEPLGVRTSLDASGSFAPDATPYPAGCGLTASLQLQWALTSVPTGSLAALSSTTLANPSFVPDVPGLYTLSVTASDGVNRSSQTVSVDGVGGYRSIPAPSGSVFTATAVDGSGNPVVAWWDNTNGTVSAARCTGNCQTSNPLWTSLGTVDSGLGHPLTFAPEDEPRPIAVTVVGSTVDVAYFTSFGASSFTGAHGVATCAVAVASFNGSIWNTWTSLSGNSTYCTAGATQPYGGFEYGRWLSMTTQGGNPVLAYWGVYGASQTDLATTVCSSVDCVSSVSTYVDLGGPASQVGRWPSIAVDSQGLVDVAYRVDNDGSGNKGLRFTRGGIYSGFTSTNVELSATVDAGRFASLADVPATASGPEAIAVAYRDTTHAVAKLARCAPSGGSCAFGVPVALLDPLSTDYGRDASLAADPATGYLRLAYFDAQHGQVRVLASSDGISGFNRIADLFAPAAPNAPTGLSLAFGAGTNAGFSGGGAGPVTFFHGP